MKLSFNTWSLRGRLLLATVTVAAIGIGASDFAANTALRSYLIKQVDESYFYNRISDDLTVLQSFADSLSENDFELKDGQISDANLEME